MEKIIYKVVKFDGDYAVLIDQKGIENRVAMALLPLDIFEGDTVIWENFEYTVFKA